VIPAKRGKKTWRVRGVRAEMRRAFPQHLYGRRALIESVFSKVWKLGEGFVVFFCNVGEIKVTPEAPSQSK